MVNWGEEQSYFLLSTFQVFLTRAVVKPGFLQGIVQLPFLHSDFIDVLIINSDGLLKGKGIFKVVFTMT